MEKKQVQQYIKQVLNSRFDQEQFELFVRNLLNEFEVKDNGLAGGRIWEAFQDHVQSYKRIGKYIDPEGDIMDILIVKVKSLSKLERTRTALRNFVVRHLKEFGDKSYALTAFYSDEDGGADWRLSLVKIDVETERNEQGKIKAKEIANPAKRFSFLVGENENAHTAQKQLLPLLVNDHSNPLIIKEKDGDGSVEGAFSIEKVTDEFYEQYKELYLKLTENAALTETLEKEGLDPVRFVKKLLGQIVFLYFLQKKGWLGVPKDQKMGQGPKNFLRKKFDEINVARPEQGRRDGGSYFNDFLRFLFYDALAKEHNDDNIKYFNKNLGCKIPFLNGGLFEADYENWDTLDLNIDNILFSNPNEKTKAGDKGTGILDVFDRYNFTIREDEPLEKEVAVDPEMLGKVFENLLDITDRKSKGAFYTPREIVHYMCQESLIHYCLNQNFQNDGMNRIEKEDIDQFIRHGHLVLEHETTVTGKGKETDRYKYKLPESIRKNAETLDKALADIKICDPAIGSGAFPVGLLHEIVTARQVLDTYLNQSPSNNQKNHSSDAYSLKRHAIQESIYGVDIDPSAIDIARLRLWLSMIVDEEDYETIDALPNLDYKIVRGNSLIGLPEQGASRYPGLSDQLEELKEKFFNETHEAKKKSLRNQINEQINKVLKVAEDFEGYNIDFDFKLYFSEVWHQKNGFDVVIGNPPYVSHDKISKVEKSIIKSNYAVYEPFADLYCYFLEKAISIQNKKGVLNFITSNSYLRADYGKYLRQKIRNENTILNIINIEDYQVFSTAIVNASILISTKMKSPGVNAIVVNDIFNGRGSFSSFIDNHSFFYNKSDFNRKTWNLIEPELLEILKKIDGNHPTLQSLNTKIRLGLATGSNEAFIINEEQRLNFIDADKKNKELIKPILRGRDIDRYTYEHQGLYILLTKNGVNVEKDFPKLYEYFDSLGKKFKKRGAKGKHWANLRACSFFDDFKKEKIIWIELSDKGRFALSEEEIYLLNSAYFLLPPEGLKAKYLLPILNSSLIHFYLLCNAETSGMGTSRWINNHVKDFPIAIISDKQQQTMMTLIDYLIIVKNSFTEDSLTPAFFDSLLDALVFEIYFHKELQSANKQILPHLGDLKPIKDEMSEEEKLAIIQSEFERLYDPNHPVRNNLETLDSVEEVRIIKEALK